MSAVKRAELISGRISYIILRGQCLHIIVLEVYSTAEDKIDDVKDRFYEELENIIFKFPKYRMHILLETSVPTQAWKIF
jgi:hypothetical protein